MEDDRLPRRILETMEEERDRERPRKRWLEDIKDEIVRSGNNWERIEEESS